MTQMDKITQQNAANAEESASASEELNAQAEQMNGVVQELVTLVGGAATSIRLQGASSRSGRKRQNLSGGSLAQGQTPSDDAFHRIAQGKATPAKTAKRVQAKSFAEQALPLDDDQSGNDFEEFNT